jgi:hypothetical protein
MPNLSADPELYGPNDKREGKTWTQKDFFVKDIIKKGARRTVVSLPQNLHFF